MSAIPKTPSSSEQSSSSSSRESSLEEDRPIKMQKIPQHINKKLECMRKTSSVFMLACVVGIVAIVVLVALSQARYLPVAAPLYGIGAAVVPFLISWIIDRVLRCYAEKHHIDVRAYFESRQRPPDPPPKPGKKVKT